MDDKQLAQELVKLAKALSADAAGDELPATTGPAVTKTIRQINPKLRPALNRVMQYIEDKKTMYEFIIMLLKKNGEIALARRLLPLFKTTLGKDLDVDETTEV